jgi:hypothetical protein
MIALIGLLDVLKGITAIQSIVLSVRKLYRWFRRKPNKKKTTVYEVTHKVDIVILLGDLLGMSSILYRTYDF